MKYMGQVSLSIAALSMALFVSAAATAQSNMQSTSPQDTANPTSQTGQEEATQMVPAQGYLLEKLDANDMKPGTKFTLRLSKKVQLKDGPELPKGTELIGKVSTDDMQLKGASKLALCINQARLKDGKAVPVKATIIGVYPPETETINGYNVAPGQEQANNWNDKVLKVDQLDAVGGVDLHSRIDGRNSGVFVSTRKDNVKIAAGSEFALAVATQSGAQSGANGGS